MYLLISTIIGSITTMGFLVHLTGSYLLWKTYNWRRVSTQQLLIFHLSVCECIINGNWIILKVLLLVWSDAKTMYYGYCLVIYLSLSGVLYMIMMFITVDRLMAVVLSLKYRQYWTAGRTRTIIFITWVLGATLTIFFVICNRYLGPWYRQIEVVYFKVVFSVLYILVALITYAVIFWKYKISRGLSGPQDVLINGTRNRPSRFYVALLIILSFLMFNIVPFCTFAVSHKYTTEIPSLLEGILIHLGCIADALIYIFLQRDVRKQFFKSFSCIQCKRNGQSSPLVNSEIRYRTSESNAISSTDV